MADDLSWWDLYKQALVDEFRSLRQFAAETAKASVRADTHYDNLVALWERAKTDWDEFLHGRDLDEVRVNGLKLTSLVIVLRDAEEVLEDFRIDDLKEKIEGAFDQVKEAIGEIKTGEAVAPADDEGVGPMATLMVRIDDILSQIENIIDAVLDVFELFNLISTMEKQMEAKALPQGKPRELVTETYHKRV